MNLDLADSDLAQSSLDLFWADVVIYEQVHRLPENGRASHAFDFMRRLQCGGDMIAGDIESPSSRRTNLRQFLQLVGFTADNQFGHIDVADVVATFGFVHVMSGDEQGHAFTGKSE